MHVTEAFGGILWGLTPAAILKYSGVYFFLKKLDRGIRSWAWSLMEMQLMRLRSLASGMLGT